jgi:hypothetical protein
MSLRKAERRQRQHNNIGKARQWLGGGRNRRKAGAKRAPRIS